MKFKHVLLALACIPVAVNAQTFYRGGVPKVIVKMSPQHLVRSGLWLSGEFFTADHMMSHQLSLEGIYFKPYSNSTTPETWQGFTAEYMFRYFPGKMHKLDEDPEKSQGYYGGMFCQGGSYTQEENYTYWDDNTSKTIKGLGSLKATTFYPGFVFGFEKSLGGGFFMDIYIGAGMHISRSTKTPDISNFSPSPDQVFVFANGVLPKMGLSFGIGL
jgi:hypothetical protein